MAGDGERRTDITGEDSASAPRKATLSQPGMIAMSVYSTGHVQNSDPTSGTSCSDRQNRREGAYQLTR
jgi:hypothetical protein